MASIDIDKFISVRQAAKEIHRGHYYVRGLIESGRLVAIRAGGSERFPRLRVTLEDLKRVMAEDVYVPKGFTARDLKRRGAVWRQQKLHPAVADL
jgi:hypothetical protein